MCERIRRERATDPALAYGDRPPQALTQPRHARMVGRFGTTRKSEPMITRRDDAGRWECIRQHDHAQLSGALAAVWALDGPLDDDVRFAVTNHDVAWVALDQRVRLAAAVPGDAERLPHTFLDHPLEAKYRAHRAGVDLVECGSAYAAWLCSRHYARFAGMLDDERSQAYLAHEQQRQERLWPLLSAAQQQRADHDLAVVQLLDALSLFVCCNPPGRTTWSFHRDGFPFGSIVLQAYWLDATHVALDPDPLAEPVHWRYPTYRWNEHGVLVDRVEHEVHVGPVPGRSGVADRARAADRSQPID